MDVILSWIPINNDNSLSQAVEFKTTSSSTWIHRVTLAKDAFTYTFLGLPDGVSHDFRVYTVCKVGGPCYTPVRTVIKVPPTTAPQTTAPVTTLPPTTAPQTTLPPTTAPQTTLPPATTLPPTTGPVTTEPPTTEPETTEPPTTEPETTEPPTTEPETTEPPTTPPPTTDDLSCTTWSLEAPGGSVYEYKDCSTGNNAYISLEAGQTRYVCGRTSYGLVRMGGQTATITVISNSGCVPEPQTTLPPTTEPATTLPPTTEPPTPTTSGVNNLHWDFQQFNESDGTLWGTVDSINIIEQYEDGIGETEVLVGKEVLISVGALIGSTKTLTVRDELNNVIYDITSTGAVGYSFFIQPGKTYYIIATTTIHQTTPVPTTEPVTTLPPTTEPVTTLPPTTEPITTLPPTTEPITTLPPTTEPPTTEPPTTEPATTLPPTTDPATTEPPTTEPVTTLPPTTEPATTLPPTTEPATTEPPTTEPITTAPPTTEALCPCTTSSVIVSEAGWVRFSYCNVPESEYLYYEAGTHTLPGCIQRDTVESSPHPSFSPGASIEGITYSDCCNDAPPTTPPPTTEPATTEPPTTPVPTTDVPEGCTTYTNNTASSITGLNWTTCDGVQMFGSPIAAGQSQCIRNGTLSGANAGLLTQGGECFPATTEPPPTTPVPTTQIPGECVQYDVQMTNNYVGPINYIDCTGVQQVAQFGTYPGYNNAGHGSIIEICSKVIPYPDEYSPDVTATATGTSCEPQCFTYSIISNSGTQDLAFDDCGGNPQYYADYVSDSGPSEVCAREGSVVANNSIITKGAACGTVTVE